MVGPAPRSVVCLLYRKLASLLQRLFVDLPEAGLPTGAVACGSTRESVSLLERSWFARGKLFVMRDLSFGEERLSNL
ncbi:hypothetical protein CDL15_Pgr016494 [Punica granatum]|uniref:Uncharacterized protein n=1 Tax=Punica granatum TaxID=22663 RepID=A0A218WJC1_PUNGR|nr:hypothetical protein CDL15_Pgr016494 [Punica granatum]